MPSNKRKRTSLESVDAERKDEKTSNVRDNAAGADEKTSASPPLAEQDPFTVHVQRSTGHGKKKQRASGNKGRSRSKTSEQEPLAEQDLPVNYTVSPSQEWAEMKKFKKFIGMLASTLQWSRTWDLILNSSQWKNLCRERFRLRK